MYAVPATCTDPLTTRFVQTTAGNQQISAHNRQATIGTLLADDDVTMSACPAATGETT